MVDGDEAAVEVEDVETRQQQGGAGTSGPQQPADDDDDDDDETDSDDDGSDDSGDDSTDDDGDSDNSSVEILPTLPLIMGQGDPRRMELTREEREWALDIKEMVEGMPDLDNMSDFWYVQYALTTTPGDLEEVLRRYHGMQEFRHEYKILDTHVEACRYFTKMFELMPYEFLSFTFGKEEGTYVFAHDSTKLDSLNLNTPDKLSAYLIGNYYFHTTFHPDFESMRKGIICLVECDGWSWTKKNDFKVFQKFFGQLLSVYPFHGEARHYNTGMVLNVMLSMLKKLLPSGPGDGLKAGFQSELRLDDYFLIPDRKTANRRMIVQLQQTLQRRYDNEQWFTL